MPIATNWGPPSIADSINSLGDTVGGFVKDRQAASVLGNLPRTPSGAIDYQAAAQALMRIDPKAAAMFLQQGQFDVSKGLQERQFTSTEQHQRAMERHQEEQLRQQRDLAEEQKRFQREQLNKPQVIEREHPDTGDKETFIYNPVDGSLKRIDIPFSGPAPATAPTGPTSTAPVPGKQSAVPDTGPSLVSDTTEPAPPKPAVATETVPAPAPAAGGKAVPTAKDIAYLRAHPDSAAGFDQHFGSPGAAAAFLGAPKEQIDALLTGGQTTAPGTPAPGAQPGQVAPGRDFFTLNPPPGIRKKDWRESIGKEAAKKTADQYSAMVDAGRNVESFMPSVVEALRAYDQLAKTNSIGPVVGSELGQKVQRFGNVVMPESVQRATQLRDAYNMHTANLKLMQAQILMKGQGAISDNERRLLSMTLPELDTTNPQAGIARLQQMLEQMKRIQQDAVRGPAVGVPYSGR